MGIQKAAPGMTAAGVPTTVLDYGVTHVPEWLFEAHIHDLTERFSGHVLTPCILSYAASDIISALSSPQQQLQQLLERSNIDACEP